MISKWPPALEVIYSYQRVCGFLLPLNFEIVDVYALFIRMNMLATLKKIL